ncbi:hypothetical protein AKJ62_01400 [candidate division MSBL1 archaeon SCGC-AAA259D14]|uniref:Uncharacterized protein n=1 Tax=candidate division MSBL1 archaeon SCGC-AAA259D14 TaxID=1698261 RepID=A0A133U7Q5_9EURY|nr:hypothetical protein AKJ62_01400 [candidate division MSBL1 archaeon SCGC-AAA259D14]
MGRESDRDSTRARVSRKLTGKLRRGDKLIAVKEHDEVPTYVPVPTPHRDFDETLCPAGSGLNLRAINISDRKGELFFLRGDSEAVIESDGRVTLVFAATDSTLRAYQVTLEDLLEFAEVLEDEFGYEVKIVPSETGGGEK